MNLALDGHTLWYVLSSYLVQRRETQTYSFVVRTSQGVKVADVVRGTAGFFKRNGRANPYQESPEIVIEILSPSNSNPEMEEQRELYFARGAKEFWTCDQDGKMRFRNNRAELSKSVLVPAFPGRIDLGFA